MKPIPTPKNVVTHLRAMHDRLNDGWANVDDAWWTTEAAAIIERLVFQRDEADAAKAALKAERDEADAAKAAIIERLVRQRDEARRMYCEEVEHHHETVWNDGEKDFKPIPALDVAQSFGWGYLFAEDKPCQ